MLLCTILTFAMCADPNVAGAISFDGLTVPVVWTRVELPECTDVGRSTEEAGFTRFETGWSVQQAKTNGNTYSGRLIVHINQARIELNAYAWEKMGQADIDALRHLNQAALWHELGHLRTAKKSIDALNAKGAISALTASDYTAAANDRGNDAMASIGADQEEYDRIAAHGLRQATLPPPLGGPNTIVICPAH
jgi:Bacterial protein of unknown function (DUF922)